MSLETFEGKMTNWEGLWWHPEYNGYSSASFNLSQLKKFKGVIRIYVRKNKFFERGTSRPNYHFCIKASNSNSADDLKVKDEISEPYLEDGIYYDKDGSRLYTEDEIRAIINGTVQDVKNGITDPYDILPSDFV